MEIQIYVKLLIETLNWLLKINFVKNNMHSEFVLIKEVFYLHHILKNSILYFSPKKYIMYNATQHLLNIP